MLDVHAPHKPFENFKEFLLHIFTITVGLLIATQIESCMEWRHHVHLAEEARASLREEIAHNLKDLKDAAPVLQQWRKEVSDDLAAMLRIQQHPDDKAAQSATINVNSHAISLRDTAWKTGQTTGALAFMPYDQAQRYASIYQAQAMLVSFEEKPSDDVGRIFGLIRKFHWSEPSPVSADQASEIAQHLGEMQLHLATGSAVLNENIEVNQAFIDGREPKNDFHEELR